MNALSSTRCLMDFRMISAALILFCCGSSTFAQTSSLSGRKREADAGRPLAALPRHLVERRGNPVLERYSWVAVEPLKPATFEIGDLVTVIVREQRRYKAEAEFESEKEFTLNSQVDAFLKFTNGGLGATGFQRGRPNIGYRFSQESEGEAESERKDRLTTRITARIIDVKPNGTLVLEAKDEIGNDEEISTITLTGICRKEDVTANNTVLSTQVANKSIRIVNQGRLSKATRRGWLAKLFDAISPF